MACDPGLPEDLVLEPAARRPLRLPDADRILAAPVRVDAHAGERAPAASIVVVSWDGLVFTRLCLESLLAVTQRPAFEVIVVDNGSSDGSAEYLERLAALDRRVRPVLNPRNAGFPAACNQGLSLARGRSLVLLNNDTMVAAGWLERLLAPLDDPAIGFAGPVTNRIAGASQVPTSYRTWGGFRSEAARRLVDLAGRRFEPSTLTMFCLAMTTEVFRRLGPLDTAFGVGTLEDDDYCARARRHGLRLVCVEDVLVHHFGEASFGKLYANGERSRVLAANRARFQRKWGTAWRPYDRRPGAEEEAAVRDVRRLIATTTPEGARVFVASRGDEAMVDVAGRDVQHFPRGPDGGWAGHYPADASEALAQLAELRADGPGFLVFPPAAAWWLDFYAGFADALDEVAREGGAVVLRFGAAA